ncbi:MAG: polysaccharide deacetylase family protein [Longicatena sp.]
MHKQMKKGILLVVCFFVVYGAQVMYTKSKGTREELVVLGYHHIVPDKDKETYYKNDMWVVSCSDFEQQMKLAHDLGYQSISLEQVYNWKEEGGSLPAKSFVVSFDDGFYSTTKFAQPILEKYGFKGNVFVIASSIAKESPQYNPSKKQHASLSDMSDTSVLQYYSHSFDLHHKSSKGFKVDLLTKSALQEDVENANKFVSSTYYAYPYGKYNDKIQQVLKENHTKLAFSYNENRKVKRSDDNFALPRFNVNGFTNIDVFLQMLES